MVRLKYMEALAAVAKVFNLASVPTNAHMFPHGPPQSSQELSTATNTAREQGQITQQEAERIQGDLSKLWNHFKLLTAGRRGTLTDTRPLELAAYIENVSFYLQWSPDMDTHRLVHDTVRHKGQVVSRKLIEEINNCNALVVGSGTFHILALFLTRFQIQARWANKEKGFRMTEQLMIDFTKLFDDLSAEWDVLAKMASFKSWSELASMFLTIDFGNMKFTIVGNEEVTPKDADSTIINSQLGVHRSHSTRDLASLTAIDMSRLRRGMNEYCKFLETVVEHWNKKTGDTVDRVFQLHIEKAERILHPDAPVISGPPDGWPCTQTLPDFQADHLITIVSDKPSTARDIVRGALPENWNENYQNALNDYGVQDQLLNYALTYQNIYIYPTTLPIDNAGDGLFTRIGRKKNETLGHFYGFLSYEKLNNQEETEMYGTRGIQIDIDQWLRDRVQVCPFDANRTGLIGDGMSQDMVNDFCVTPAWYCLFRFVNDCTVYDDNGCSTSRFYDGISPNCEMALRGGAALQKNNIGDCFLIEIIATKEIPPDSELFFSYGETYNTVACNTSLRRRREIARKDRYRRWRSSFARSRQFSKSTPASAERPAPRREYSYSRRTAYTPVSNALFSSKERTTRSAGRVRLNYNGTILPAHAQQQQTNARSAMSSINDQPASSQGDTPQPSTTIAKDATASHLPGTH